MQTKQPRLFRWIRLVIVVLVLYSGISWLAPRLRDRFSTEPTATNDANMVTASCVSRSRKAVEDFREKIAMLSTPGIDVDWRGSMQMASREVDHARRACACDFEACDTATEALEALAELVASWEATMAGGGTPSGVERRLDRIDRLVRTAEGQAGP